ncbi:MAG: hypothetical protein WC054_01565 [Candidatus Nanopelagicales bacterium]
MTTELSTNETAPSDPAIKDALAAGNFERVIELVRAAFEKDPAAAMADPVISEWIGIRYRNIFITEAAANPDAQKASRAPFPVRLIDSKVDRARVAHRMIKHLDPAELELEMPIATPSKIEDTSILFVPGLLTGMLGIAFQKVFPVMRARFGVDILCADVHPMRGSEANVEDIVNAMERGIGVAADPDASLITADDNPTPPGNVIMIGYSKGGPDILTFLAERPDLAPRIKAVLGWAGAIGGSWLADGMLKNARAIPNFEELQHTAAGTTVMMNSLYPMVPLGAFERRPDEVDVLAAIESLTTTKREAFLAENAETLASLRIPQFYFSGATSKLDVPPFQLQGYLELSKYDSDNDMQLTQDEAALPGPDAIHMAMFHANHWDMSYDSFPWSDSIRNMRTHLPFARESAMAAIILTMNEIGLLV